MPCQWSRLTQTVTASVTIALWCAGVTTSSAQPAGCAEQVASNKLEFRSDKKGTNVGVVPSGFVNPSDAIFDEKAGTIILLMYKADY
jgi:hypothetical protein